jgi:hypothetical protein
MRSRHFGGYSDWRARADSGSWREDSDGVAPVNPCGVSRVAGRRSTEVCHLRSARTRYRSASRTPTRSSCVASLRRSAWPARSPRPCRWSGSCTWTASRRRSRTWTASGSRTWTWSSATGCQSIVQRLKFRPKYIVDFFRIAYLALKCVSQKYALILAQLLEFLNGKALHGRSHRTDLPGVCVDSLVVKKSGTAWRLL